MDTVDVRNQVRPTPPTAPTVPAPGPREHADETAAEIITGGSLIEALGGLATIVLAIIGLAGIWPQFMAPIAAIVLGAALMAQGGGIALRFSRLLNEMTGQESTVELGGGLGAEFLGGVATVVLGILALVHIVPLVLLPVAAIVFGAAVLLGSGVVSSLNSMLIERRYGNHAGAQQIASAAVSAANGTQVLLGAGSIVLGILGLVGIYPMILSMVALLAVGAAVLISGTALSSKMMSFLSR